MLSIPGMTPGEARLIVAPEVKARLEEWAIVDSLSPNGLELSR